MKMVPPLRANAMEMARDETALQASFRVSEFFSLVWAQKLDSAREAIS